MILVLLLLLLQPCLAQTTDQAIQQQLETAYSAIDRLEAVEVRVQGGVVVLSGQSPSAAGKELAQEIAEKVEGVLAVENQIEPVRSISPAVEQLRDRAELALAYGPLALASVVMILTALFLGRLLSGWEWLYTKLSANDFVQEQLRQIVFLAFVLLGLLAALELLGATALVGAVLGTAGVFGLALGFAFRDLVENYIASVLLSVRQPFAPNDHVVIEGNEGKVVRLTSRATILLTLDGNHLRIPNSTVFKSVILNYTRNPERRLDFLVGLDVEEDIAAAQALGVKTLAQCEGVAQEPPPLCLVDQLADYTVNLKMMAWVDQSRAEFLKVRSEAMRQVKQALDEAGFTMPEPIQKIRLEQAAPARREPAAPRERLKPDVAPERHLDERIDREREEERNDLLQREAPLE